MSKIEMIIGMVKNVAKERMEIRNLTKEVIASGNIDKVWENRYFLDWENHELNNMVSEEVLTKKYPELFNFINYRVWIRTNSGHNISMLFFRQNENYIDYVYVMKHQNLFINLTRSFLSEYMDMYNLQKVKDTCPSYSHKYSNGVILGIPYEYRTGIKSQLRFGRMQMDRLTTWVDGSNEITCPDCGYLFRTDQECCPDCGCPTEDAIKEWEKRNAK